ncbi:NADH-quinone oxidoreductase subunit H [marine bacterium AO1-C]|nr:NADH-quinone oxidoreductase subunit H [marine bacterium AO1-C]
MIAFLIFLPFVLTFALLGVYIERKVSAFIQDRMGPMEVGPMGLLQTLADILKLIQKEDIVPLDADKQVFKIAPLIIFVAVFAGFAAIPFAPELVGSGATVGLLYVLAIVSLDVIGILMAGWASNSKYPLLGSMRSVAQIISYEIPVGLTILAVVMTTQTLDLQDMSFQQGIWVNSHPIHTKDVNYLFGIKALGVNVTQWGGFFSWNILRSPVLFIAFIIFFIGTLAEANRAPFDIPEAESELIAGFHTEYSGIRFAMMMLAEYAMMLLVSFLGVILFLGSWNTPLPNMGPVALADWTSGAPGTIYGYITGAFWLLSKTFLLVFVQMWVRWTYPRLRVDQLMYLCWKVLIPFSIGIVLIAGIWRLWMV